MKPIPLLPAGLFEPEQERIDKFLTKCKAESLEELTSTQADDLLAALRKML